MIDITELHKDAIAEIFNIAIGNAASALNQMVDEEVSLSVPFVDMVGRDEATARLLGGREHTADAVTVAVKQNFRGQFEGEVLLVFPERKSLDLVRSFVGDVPLETMTELEHDALLEVGNVILNACLGSLANQLGHSIESGLPVFVRAEDGRVLDGGVAASGDDMVMFLHVDFSLESRDLSGYVAFVMDILSARNFRQLVDAYISAAA